MTDLQMAASDELVAGYVRATMRVEPPDTLTAEVMRAVAVLPQERRGWLSAFGTYTPAMAALAAAAVILAIGAVISAPRNVGPPTEPSTDPTATPAPTLTPEDARILTEPGDVIRIPALDSEGQFGTITLRRGDEIAGYEGYVPLQALMDGEVFFIELDVSYEMDRATSQPYGNVEWGFAVDADGDGFDADDVVNQILGYGVDGEVLETGPDPLLPWFNSGSDSISGGLVAELPAFATEYDIYLVLIADTDPGGPEFEAEAIALLRGPGDPVGVTTFDPADLPSESGAPVPMSSFHVLPTPIPSPLATFKPAPDADADELFAETQTCTNTAMSLIVTFPASWHTNESYEDLPECSFFGAEPLDAELLYNGLVQTPRVGILERLEWLAGEDPLIERVPIAGRESWRLTFTDEHMSSPGSIFLVPLTENAYGPFAQLGGASEHQAVVARMAVLLEFSE